MSSSVASVSMPYDFEATPVKGVQPIVSKKRTIPGSSDTGAWHYYYVGSPITTLQCNAKYLPATDFDTVIDNIENAGNTFTTIVHDSTTYTGYITSSSADPIIGTDYVNCSFTMEVVSVE